MRSLIVREFLKKKKKKTNVLQLSKQLLPAEMRIQIKPKLAQNCRDAIWK